MGNQVDDNKFTWVIKDFLSLRSEIIYSEEFVIGGCKWRLMAYPQGDGVKNVMSLYLDVADPESLTCGRKIVTSFNLKVVNRISDKLSLQKGKINDFDNKNLTSGFAAMILRTELLHARGFLVNGEIKIVVEMESVVVVSEEEESEETASPLKKMKLNNGGAMSIDLHNETQQTNVHGFHVLPSQVKFVSRIFKKYPDIALGFRAKNQQLRTLCMNVLLCLIETLCTSPQELSNEDLLEANNSLTHLKVSGFKVDWLETKLDQVQIKKVKEQCGETRMQELETELEEFKQKCLDCEALLVKEKTQVLAARAALKLDDFF